MRLSLFVSANQLMLAESLSGNPFYKNGGNLKNMHRLLHSTHFDSQKAVRNSRKLLDNVQSENANCQTP